jgi:oligopeptidase A
VLDVATERLGRAWGSVSHLNAVADTPELRAAYNAVLPKVTEFYTRLGADERLYAKYKAIAPERPEPEQAPGPQKRIAQFCAGWRRFAGGGAERFAEIQERQAALSQKFSENALDATDAFAYYAQAELAGVPDDVVQTARARPRPRARRLQTHPQNAVLPASDAVCPQQRVARKTLPRLCHPRLRPG